MHQIRFLASVRLFLCRIFVYLFVSQMEFVTNTAVDGEPRLRGYNPRIFESSPGQATITRVCLYHHAAALYVTDRTGE